jgi:hypothetical protein
MLHDNTTMFRDKVLLCTEVFPAPDAVWQEMVNVVSAPHCAREIIYGLDSKLEMTGMKPAMAAVRRRELNPVC